MKLRPASWSVSSGILPKPNTAYDRSFFAKASKDYSPRLHPTNELVGIRRRRIKEIKRLDKKGKLKIIPIIVKELLK